MKRFVNVRIPLNFACALALGVLAGFLLSFYNADTLFLIAVIPIAAIFFIVALILRKPRLFIFAVACIVLFLAGTFNGLARLENFGTCDIEADKTYIVSGTVIEKGEAPYGEYVILDGATANGKKLSGKIKAYLTENYGEFCDEGYFVEFFSRLDYGDLYPYGKLNYYAEDNIKYTCTAVKDVVSDYGFSFFGSIRASIRNTLYDNLDKDTASICYAMLVGDTQGIDGETLQNLRYGGIAHIFAVSGLHIGLVYTIVTLLCKKLKVNKYVAAAVSLGLILFYAAICGFALSSVRAVIMCAVGAATRLFHLKRDGLNSLSFAVILILLISPLSLFSVGFQLSVCAVGGIFLFSSKFKKLLRKIKTPACVAGAVGTTFGAQLGTLPVMLGGFGYISGAGLILNIAVIPAVSLLFIPLFVFAMLTAAIPQLGFMLTYATVPLQAVLSFLVSADFEKALISGFGSGLFALFYYAGIAVLSDKFNMKLLPRTVSAAAVVAVLAIFVIVQTYPTGDGYKISVNGSANGGCVIVKSRQGSVLIVTENASASRVIDALNENYSLNLDGVIILGGEECVTSYDPDLNCKNVYVCNLYVPVQPYRNVEVHYENEFSLCGMNFEFYDGYNMLFWCDGVSVGVSTGEEIRIEKCDLLISRYRNTVCETQNTAYFSLKGYDYNAYENGELTYRANKGLLNYDIPVRH